MLAQDGTYGARIYSGSGRTVSQFLHNAVSAHLSSVKIGTAVESRDDALAKARAMNAADLFEPSILHWEDRATEWSGRPDRVMIKFDVWDVTTGKSVASSLEKASSKWFTLGGDHPQDLVPHVTTGFANRIFPVEPAEAYSID